jgi:predicted CoA-binding protein
VSDVLGERSYPTLTEAAKAARIDLVDVFRRPEAVPAIVDEVLALGLPALWLQETVVHEEAARKAREAGVFVVMDRCILKEHAARGL